MKTLIITLEYPPQSGGVASYVYNLAAHLPPAEIAVYAPLAKNDREFDQQQSFAAYRRQPYWFLIWPRWLRLLWQVWRLVKKERFERLYVHHTLPVGYVAVILKKLLGLPFVSFVHGTDLTLMNKSASKRRKFYYVCRRADAIMVDSQFMKDKLGNLMEKLPPVHILRPCPGDVFFKKPDNMIIESLRAKLSLRGKKVIITVARLDEGKGYPHLIRLLPQILQKVPNVVWLIIGDGPKRPIVIDLIQKNSLQNVVRILGDIPFSELPAYYHLADLFVLLTHKDAEREEAWGTVFLEAAACGLPVVAGQAGGVSEAVEHLVTGLVVDTYQDMSVVSAVADLLRESNYARQMGLAGQERVKREFRWETQISKLT